MRYLEINDNISEYLWQHDIWRDEIAPALAQQNLNDKFVLRNPFSILACPAYRSGRLTRTAGPGADRKDCSAGSSTERNVFLE